MIKITTRTIIFFLITIIILIVCTGILYIFKFQQLTSNYSAIADERCLQIDPLITNRKVKNNEFFKLVFASASTELVNQASLEYEKAARIYLSQEEKWLQKDRNFISSWQFNLLMLPYPEMKKMFTIQHQIYQLGYDSINAIITMYGVPSDTNKQKELLKVINQSVKRQDELNAELDKIYQSGLNHINEPRNILRSVFIKSPPSRCPVNAPTTTEPLNSPEFINKPPLQS